MHRPRIIRGRRVRSDLVSAPVSESPGSVTSAAPHPCDGWASLFSVESSTQREGDPPKFHPRAPGHPPAVARRPKSALSLLEQAQLFVGLAEPMGEDARQVAKDLDTD